MRTIKTFRSNATIQAEQFDASKEMMEKYGIYEDLGHYFINLVYSSIPREILIGDWLLHGALVFNPTVMNNEKFIASYSEVPNDKEN